VWLSVAFFALANVSNQVSSVVKVVFGAWLPAKDTLTSCKWHFIYLDEPNGWLLADSRFKSHILNMNAESYRLKQRQKATAG